MFLTKTRAIDPIWSFKPSPQPRTHTQDMKGSITPVNISVVSTSLI